MAFTKTVYSFEVKENTVPGTVVGKVGTVFEALTPIKYSVQEDDGENLFLLSPFSGEFLLSRSLDFEAQRFYILTVVVQQGDSKVSSVRVYFNVLDVNANPPVFSQDTFSALLLEDTVVGTCFLALIVSDKDDGVNGALKLTVAGGADEGVFFINRAGSLCLKTELDRERQPFYNLTVTANDCVQPVSLQFTTTANVIVVVVTDKGSPRMATTGNITVHVEDVNDHDPKFSQSTFSLTVREDAPRGTSLFQVQALDRDIGTNGQVRYILTQTSPFVVDSVRGVITVMEKLDRESNSNYTLIITAVDQGDTYRSSTAAISLTVLDVNDFAPIFTPQTLTLHVMENEEEPSQLTHQISALDEDLGINSLLTYFIHTGNSDGLFSVIPNGTFQILHSLDREKESLYSVTIIAVDSGLPPLTGTLTLHVIVDDVNDNTSDIDEGLNGEIRYSMENLDVPFAIKETSGELLTTKVLDRETVAIYRLMVIGSDKHPTQPMSSSVLVTVLIGDINDHGPQFLNSPYVAYVPTEMAPGSVVCALRATDEDTEMNAELHYSLYGQSSDLFSIQPYSGTVFTSSGLWRTEAIVVNVHVEDAGENPKFDVTTISIRFQNASEFPEINVSVISGFLSEDTPVGTLVAVVSAASIRAEAVFFYLASGNLEDMFHVEQASGVLTVENPLDYENKKEFTLLVEARDSGSPPFSSFSEIHINISDINDNFPHFTQAEYRCEVFENSPPSWVCDVLAIDADSGSYGTVHTI
ncbi:Protocadherin Fat 4 [Dissostichus eleginoides]|uniref:Protocadherin Fat 4 n=1 Tax=Dissostichus eleginoides TaxID=100907 RepID=A0AAD9FFG8_DISEL|nr:Protocadherin Fat 4 [Dissostichus eleginoides]